MGEKLAIISFALTTAEFLAGEKWVTRRDWHPNHYRRWCQWWDKGLINHQAYDKVPHAGGKQIGRFKLTCRPYREKLKDMPESDLQAEGGMCKTKEEYYKLIGKKPNDVVTVIRFKKL